ncbi:outer membrane beta-barrel protein [Pyxidicoccus xibeiensis]|uniref:outer membrane beta-barrel protein n=1 Tax=Pyxidicoccus xibeiensis TaxID=2906759 RepID=UPI0020A75429|nr:outer membrane beta-barrel protein [Pyxidicoccus xibeiensis]MCP3142707.1 porin family protein [Pyxidicoccus xibeiensis]
MRLSAVGGIAAAALCLSGPALAIEAQKVGEALNYSDTPPVGIDVRVGLGGFTGDLGDQTGVGPLFGINAGAQPWSFIGIEAGYEGQRLPIDDNRVGDGEGIWRHNVGLLAKVGPLIDEKWRPFVGAGAGLSYLNPSDDAEGIYDSDFVSELPLAAGVDYRLGNLFAGARATYRIVGDEEVVNDAVTNNDEKGSLFNASIMVGGRF